MSFLFTPLRRPPSAPASPPALPPEAPLALPGGTVMLRLRRSTRAVRLLLRVNPRDGRIELVLPPKVRLEDGLAFARGQGAWIADRLRAAPHHVPFADGAEVPLLGVAHRIVHVGARRGPPVIEAAGCLEVAGAPDFVSRRVRDYLTRRARGALTSHVQHFAGRLGRRPGRISLRDTATRWGSCSANGDMSFSWRLVLSPASVLAYVAAHESAHLVELNHSRRFWALVEDLLPGHDDARAWLKTHGAQLLRYG